MEDLVSRPQLEYTCLQVHPKSQRNICPRVNPNLKGTEKKARYFCLAISTFHFFGFPCFEPLPHMARAFQNPNRLFPSGYIPIQPQNQVLKWVVHPQNLGGEFTYPKMGSKTVKRPQPTFSGLLPVSRPRRFRTWRRPAATSPGLREPPQAQVGGGFFRCWASCVRPRTSICFLF